MFQWDFIYNNADMQSLYTSFQRVIDRLINTHFKMESFTTNYKNRHPWLTGPLRSQIKATTNSNFEKLIISDMRHRKTYMYNNFLANSG